MRIMIVDSVYEGYVQWLYKTSPGLNDMSYREQHDATVKGGFHTAAVWADPLREMGHDVMDVWGNHAPLQVRWCLENGRENILKMNAESYLIGGITLSSETPNSWYQAVIEQQVIEFTPDVIWIADLFKLATPFLKRIKGHYRMAVGEITFALPDIDFSGFDLMVSGAMPFVEEFQSAGITAELLLHGFRDKILESLAPAEKKYGLTFVGQMHDGRLEMIEALGPEVGINVWTVNHWSEEQQAALGINAHPPVYGVPMYQILRNSQIVLNKHIYAAKNFASNQRLYEVTGVGTTILTDANYNLGDLFKVGREVLAYRNLEECIELAKRYLSSDVEREIIANAGCKRTLQEHTVNKRAMNIVTILERHGPSNLF